MKPRFLTQVQSLLAVILMLVVLSWADTAMAQLPMPASSQFDITGFLQEATLDAACAASPHCGGSVLVNGQRVTVPAETIVVFPANQLTWQELFFQAPGPWGIGRSAINTSLLGGPTSGLASADCAVPPVAGLCPAPPLTTWEIHVIGNRVPGLAAGDQYIAGLVNLTQSGLHSGAGFINFINPALGEMRVGGPMGVEAGARVRINDPSGKYSQGTVATSPDVRFTVDPDNPTIMAGTGYPMCLPGGTTGGGSPTACPPGNRPVDALGNPVSLIRTANLTSTCNPLTPCVPAPAGTFPDSTKMVPMAVGDYITFTGIVVKDAPVGGFLPGDGPTVGPTPAATATYVAAHTIVSNVAVYTFPGSNPAYIETDVYILGTGGLTVLGVGEAAIRTRFEGMMTDASRMVHLYGMDLNPTTGAVSDRDWGTIGVDPGPVGGAGAVEGRWRFRPPCAPFGTVVTKPDKQCVMNAAGTFLPVTREMRAVIVDAATALVPANPTYLSATPATSANGLIWGQYHAPIAEYIFPENIPGSPIVENNFNAMPFLACGGYISTTGNPATPGSPIVPGTPGTLVGQLNPWPSNIIPQLTNCAGFVAPVSAVSLTATPSSVISGTGTLMTLTANASGAAPITFAISQAPTDAVQVVLTPNGNTATFTTPKVAANTTLNFTVTATNAASSAAATATVTVAFDQPVVNHVPFQTVNSGTPVTLNITGTDPGGLALTFTVTQTSGPAPTTPLVVTQLPPTGATATFTETLTTGAASVTLAFNIVATNTAGVSSALESTAVTVNAPVGAAPIVTAAEYRIGKQRLIVSATSVDGGTLFLNPYICEAKAAPCKPDAAGIWTYNPDPLAGGLGNVFNLVLGVLQVDIVGAPKPVCGNPSGAFATPCPATPITVRSSGGGVSLPSALTKIRQ